ncbi:MAG: ABC transporter permease subunit [Bifidobacteriaceae bacterium]|jgi:hypothetical protein|nr:ABC transporter permease subunit [Bifidobacteriaceae bacterium]
MIAALKSEYRKLFSTRMWWVLMLCAAGYLALNAALMAGALGFTENVLTSDPELLSDPETMAAQDNPFAFLGEEGGAARMVYSMAGSFAYVFPLLIGALSVTQEYRHKTITQTFLAEPRRQVVLGAKLIAALPMGLAYGIGCLAATVLPAAVLLAVTGSDPGFGAAATWALFGRSLVNFAIWAAVGVGLGALIKNQVALIVVALAETQALEPMLRAVPTLINRDWAWTKFLPGAAGDAIQGGSFYDIMSFDGDSLPGGWAVLVLVGWAAALAALGYAANLRRDVS